MKTARTIQIKLQSSDPVLGRTIDAFNKAMNYASGVAWETKTLSNPLKLQKIVYQDLRERFGLRSQMACAACRKVMGAYRSMRANGKMIKATFDGNSIELNFPRDFRINHDIISINTIEGRKKVPFLCGDHQRQYLDNGWHIGGARLVRRRKGYFLHITVSKEVEVLPLSEAANIIGVDLGQNYLAVATSTDDESRFFGGRALKNRKDHYQRVRRGLQARGTRSSRKILKRLSGRERRFQADANHTISKRLVEWTAGFERPAVAMEDLTHIRETTKQRGKRQRRRANTWAFAQLRSFIQYKANAQGIPVILLEPAYTSQICSRCGHLGHRDGLSFECPACGYSLHADLNAARNLRNLLRSSRYNFEEPGLLSTALKVPSTLCGETGTSPLL